MGSGWRALRRRILTPNVSETSIEKRGFHKKDEASKELLEKVGEMFLTGYAYAAEARYAADAEPPLEELPTRFKGFAYEGAAMALTIRDRMPLGPSTLLRDFLSGRGDAHVYMAYVGVGWAMARLPKMFWPLASDYDPVLRPLILDGYGFHQAYFKTDRYVRQQYVDQRFSWPGDSDGGYANRAIDQGIGRAMWFVCGTDPTLCADTIDGFDPSRHADMYSGAGLAATYAGGVDRDELRTFFERAGEHRPLVAQASTFAAEARIRAGLHVPHTGLATEVFCGMSVEDAALLSRKLRPGPDVSGAVSTRDTPAYEIWRQRIASEFVSLGRV